MTKSERKLAPEFSHLVSEFETLVERLHSTPIKERGPSLGQLQRLIDAANRLIQEHDKAIREHYRKKYASSRL